jgi:hypothetical protein
MRLKSPPPGTGAYDEATPSLSFAGVIDNCKLNPAAKHTFFAFELELVHLPAKTLVPSALATTNFYLSFGLDN